MRNNLVIGLLFLTRLIFSQTADSITIMGKWKRVFDVDGKNIKTIPTSIDTITFSPDKFYSQKSGGVKTTAKWAINPKKRILNLSGEQSIFHLDGSIIDTYAAKDFRRIDKLSADTLVFIHYSEADGKTVSGREFYTRIK